LKQPLNLIYKKIITKRTGKNGIEDAIRWQIGYGKPLRQQGRRFFNFCPGNTIHTPIFSIHTLKNQLATGKKEQRLIYVNLYLCRPAGIVAGNQSFFFGLWFPMCSL